MRESGKQSAGERVGTPITAREGYRFAAPLEGLSGGGQRSNWRVPVFVTRSHPPDRRLFCRFCHAYPANRCAGNVCCACATRALGYR